MKRLLLALAIFAQTAPAGAAEALDCVIEPKAIVDLMTFEEGMIQEVLVGRGDRVQAGQKVVQLDDALQQLQAELNGIRAESDVEVRSQEARLALRQRQLERATELRARGVSTEAAYDDAEIEVSLMELALEDATIARRAAKIEHQLALARLERRVLTSPVDGVVMAVLAAPGEFAHEQLEIIRIAEIDPLHVEVFAPADLFGRIAVGETYTVSLEPPLEGAYEATVSVVDPIFDAASGTFGVRLEIANPDGVIPAGVRCGLLLEG